MKKIIVLSFLFLGSLNMAFSQCAPSTVRGIHVVQSKENLYRIAKAYDVSMGDICKWNNIKVDDILPVCKILKVAEPSSIPNVIPQGYEEEDEFTTKNEETTQPAPSTPKPTTPAIPGTRIYQMQDGKRHTVRAGETIAGLADLYGFTEKKFRNLNALGQTKEVTPGSVLLTSDCTCEVINRDTYYGKIYPSASGHSSSSHSTNSSTRPSIVSPNKNMSSRSNIVPYMKREEYKMIEEINLVRSNPAGYAKYVEQYRKDKKRIGYNVPDATVDELIRELKSTPKLSSLEPTQCLYDAAKKHGQDIRARGKSGHQGSDGLWPWDRVKNSCPAFQDGNENLVGGSPVVRESVIILLIDHAVASRGHRKALLNPYWTHVACYKIGQVGSLPNNWVQNFGQAKGSTSISHNGGAFGHNTGGYSISHNGGASGHNTGGYTRNNASPSMQKPNVVNHSNARTDSKPPRLVANASFMNSQENEMVQEVNLLRSNPAGYVKYVEAYKKKKGVYMDKDIDGLIAELKKTPALTILQPSQCVYNAAYKHGQDIKRMGKSGHKGSDGSWPWDRVKRSCTSFQDGNENLIGGSASVRDAVIMLLIDRGIASKGHRRTLLNPHWTHMAAYKIGQLGNMPNNWIQQFGQE